MSESRKTIVDVDASVSDMLSWQVRWLGASLLIVAFGSLVGLVVFAVAMAVVNIFST